MNEMAAKKTYLCECIQFAYLSGDTVSLDFIWPGPAPLPGQFFMVKPRRSEVFLGRPICAAGWNPRSNTLFKGADDRRKKNDRRAGRGQNEKNNRRQSMDRRTETGGKLRFLVTRRGRGSREITEIRRGEEVELTGPLGSSWPLDNIPKGPIALVGGGIGLAPLLPLAAELKKRPFDFYVGFRTGSYGLENIKPRALIISTEDGSKGVKGLILDYFTPSGYSAVFACGPDSMLKGIADASIANGIPCYVSTGKKMACGVGACLGCRIKTTSGNKRCCADGPVFNAEELCFED